MFAVLTMAAALLTSPYDGQVFDLSPAVVETLQRGLEEEVRDPYTARFRGVRGPRQGSITVGRSSPVTYSGTILCAQMNAMNGFGGYVGYEDYVFVIEDDGQVHLIERMDRRLHNPAVVDRECALPADGPAEPVA